jgi:ABC-type transporter Mla MlaB component
VTNVVNGSSKRKAVKPEVPNLEIELVESPSGCIARLRGDLLAETRLGLWSVEPILINEVGITLDLSGVTAIDSAGLEAILMLIGSVQASGRRLAIGGHYAGDRPAWTGQQEEKARSIHRLRFR